MENMRGWYSWAVPVTEVHSQAKMVNSRIQMNWATTTDVTVCSRRIENASGRMQTVCEPTVWEWGTGMAEVLEELDPSHL